MRNTPSSGFFRALCLLCVLCYVNGQGVRFINAMDDDDTNDGLLPPPPDLPRTSSKSSTSASSPNIQPTTSLKYPFSAYSWNMNVSASASVYPTLGTPSHSRSRSKPPLPTLSSNSSSDDDGDLFQLPSASISWATNSQCTSSWVSRLGHTNNTATSSVSLSYSVQAPEHMEKDYSPKFKVYADGKEVNETPLGNVCCGECFIRFPTVSVYYWPVSNTKNTWCLKYLDQSSTTQPPASSTEAGSGPKETSPHAETAVSLPKLSRETDQAATPTRATSTLSAGSALEANRVKRAVPPDITSPPILRNQPLEGHVDYHKYRPRSFIALHPNDTIPERGINASSSGNGSVPFLVADDGFTFISPSVYVVFSTVSASGGCGETGKKFTSLTIAYAENELSSIDVVNGNTRMYDFAELPCPPKTWAEDRQIPNPLQGHERALGAAVRGYHPYILGPGKRLKELDPAWASCRVWDVGNGYDPPMALVPQTSMGADPKAGIHAPAPVQRPADHKHTADLLVSLTPEEANAPVHPAAPTYKGKPGPDVGQLAPDPEEEQPATDGQIVKEPFSQPNPSPDAPSENDLPPQEFKDSQQKSPAPINDPFTPAQPSEGDRAPPTPNDPPSSPNDPAQNASPNNADPKPDNAQQSPKLGNSHANNEQGPTNQQQKPAANQPNIQPPVPPQAGAVPPSPHAPATRSVDAPVVVAGQTITPNAPPVKVGNTNVAVSRGSIYVDGSSAQVPQIPVVQPGPPLRANDLVLTPAETPANVVAPPPVKVGGLEFSAGNPPVPPQGFGSPQKPAIPANGANPAKAGSQANPPVIVDGLTFNPIVSQNMGGQMPSDQGGVNGQVAPNEAFGQPGVIAGANSQGANIGLPGVSNPNTAQDQAGSNVPGQLSGGPASDAMPLGSVGGQVIRGDTNHAIVNGQTLTPGSPPINVAGTLLSLGPSALQIGTQSVPLPAAGSVQTPIPLANVGGQPIIGNANSAVIAGQTLTQNAPAITVAGTPISLGTSAIQIGQNNVPLPTFNPPSPNSNPTIPSAFSIAGQQLSLNGPPITVSGTAISLGSSGLIVGSKTVPLSAPPSNPTNGVTPSVYSIAGQALTLNGAPLTISGTRVSLGPSGLVVGSSTIALPSYESPFANVAVAGKSFQVLGPSAIAVDGKTLSVGGPDVTQSGTRTSLASDGLVVGDQTYAYAKPVVTDGPVQGQSSVFTVGGMTVTADGKGGLVVDGTTVRKGDTATVDGTVVSLGEGEVVVGGSTVALSAVSGLGSAISGMSANATTSSSGPGIVTMTSPSGIEGSAGASGNAPQSTSRDSGARRLAARWDLVWTSLIVIFTVAVL